MACVMELLLKRATRDSKDAKAAGPAGPAAVVTTGAERAANHILRMTSPASGRTGVCPIPIRAVQELFLTRFLHANRYPLRWKTLWKQQRVCRRGVETLPLP